MKKFIYLLIIMLFCVKVIFSQGRLVFYNNAYLVMNGSLCYLVLNNSAPNAITLSTGGGNIISESETRKVKWNTGTSIGAYTVPFTKSASYKIPLTVNITAAGIGSGAILFSTYGGPTWDNNTYRPSDVTHMQGISGITNNSAFVIDRFWLIDAQSYTTKPTVTITFTYLDAEWSAAGNTITEANMLAQRFNSSLSRWSDWLGTAGTCNTTNKTVGSGNVTPANFFRSWTLVDGSSPLPVELVSFFAKCNTVTNEVSLYWTTASEYHNDYFVVEKTMDFIHWDTVTTIHGAGNSYNYINYTYIDEYYSYPFYRLKQVDIDGNYTYSDTVFVRCDENLIELISIYPNPAHQYFNYSVCSNKDRDIVVTVVDVLGRILVYRYQHVNSGLNNLLLDVSSLSSGLYYLKIETLDGISKDSKQILIQ